MNLLHDIDPGTKETMTVIIETPKGSGNSYKIDTKTKMVKLGNVLDTPQVYPFDYGFLPQTLCEDGKVLDVAVLTTHPLLTGLLLDARPIGTLRMTVDGMADEKIIAVAICDQHCTDVQDIKKVSQNVLKEIAQFFASHGKSENKEVVIGDFCGREAAEEAFEKARTMYEYEK